MALEDQTAPGFRDAFIERLRKDAEVAHESLEQLEREASDSEKTFQERRNALQDVQTMAEAALAAVEKKR